MAVTPATKDWMHYSQSIRKQIDSAEPTGYERPPEKELKARRKKLEQVKVYPSGGVSTYDQNSGKAMLMYRPIHRAVSAASKPARSYADVIPDETPPFVSIAAKSYMVSGDDAEIDKIRSALKPGIRAKVLAATEIHARKVESEYDNEMANVLAANSEAAKAAAAAAMQEITSKVKTNLRQARNYTSDLFS
jgi:hypothetical protein